MKQLASPELGSLVPEARIQEIFSGLGPKSVNSDQAYQMIDFEKAFPKYDQAFHEAFENFNRKKADALKGKLPAGEKSAIVRLAKEFHQFKKENTFWLLPYGMYQTMYRQYGNTEALSPNSHWREKDRNMFDVPPPELSAEEVAKRFYTPAQKKERIAELMRDPLFQESAFVQFLIHKQHKEFRHFMNEVPTDPKNGERGMRLIGDLQVGPSPLDTWANRHIYLKGLFMGVGGQKWDFPIPRPDLVYNPDGTLGPAGRYYHELSRKFMDDFNAVRVDHPRGLIDALTYPEGEFPRDNVNINPLNSSPFHPQLGRFSQIPTRHTQALQIMTDAAREAGLDPQKDILTEYFGDGSDIEGTTLGQFGLRGMRTSYWHNPDNAGDGSAPKNFPTNVIGQFGNHDNSRLFEWAKAPKQSRDPFARNLAWRLKPHANDGERRQFEEQMRFNSGTLAQATAADIVASPARHVQFFLGDIIGWEDPFNVPGNPGNTEQTNWRQQMTPEWKEHYYQRVADQKALNPARMMEWALNTREDSIPDAQRPAFERVRKELRHFANILDEQPVGQQSQQKTAEKSFHVVA
jgi:4-alpha-glucanotransferase